MLNTKMMKNKKGFSLAELMIVIAIIVILSGATAVGVVSWVNKAQKTRENVELKNGDNFEKIAWSEVNAAVPSAPSYVIPKETVETPNEETTTAEETTTVVQEATTTAKVQEETTTAKVQEETTTAAVVHEETTTAAQQQGGGIPGGAGISVSNTVPQYGNIKGVISCEADPGNPNRTILHITDRNGSNDNVLYITKNGKNYTANIGYQQWVLNDAGYPGGFTNDAVLNPTQIAWLSSFYGISFE